MIETIIICLGVGAGLSILYLIVANYKLNRERDEILKDVKDTSDKK